MPSPFPGMNPYLESPGMWPDFQRAFVVAYSASLAAQLPSGYYAAIGHDRCGGRPKDQGEPPSDTPVVVQAGNSVRPPVTVTIPAFDGFRVPFLTIRDARSKDRIAVIHVIGPESKEGDDRASYLHKWDSLTRDRTHFVEIDLRRRGQRSPWEQMPACDFAITVSRWEARPTADFWPVQLRERLPVIPIPLRPGIPEPAVDLQALLHEVYDSAGYDGYVYDDGPPDPPLSADDQAWADGLLAAPPG